LDAFIRSFIHSFLTSNTIISTIATIEETMDPIDNHYVNNWSATTTSNNTGNADKENLEPVMRLQDPEGAYYPTIPDEERSSLLLQDTASSTTSRTTSTIEESDISPSQERARPIFTAVLFHPSNHSIRINNNNNNNNNCAGIDCQDTVTSTLSSDEDEQDAFYSDRDTSATEKKDVIVARFQRYTMALGLIVGFFIQFSSLGANFLLNTAATSTATSGHFQMEAQGVLWFSLGWSLFTSVLGVAILLLLRCIVATAWTLTSDTSIPCRGALDDSVMVNKMESHFAVGALVGVCLAWTCTDLILGLTVHVLQSALTLAAALIWCRVISYFGSFPALSPTTTTKANGASLAEPLLPSTTKQQPEMAMMSPSAIVSCKRIFQNYSLALGLVVGFFIQFSSLGANFLLTVIYGTTLEQQQYITTAVSTGSATMSRSMQPNAIVYFSFGWSFLTSCMGVLILVLVRNLVLLAWSNLDQKDHEQQQDQKHLLWCMESFFATGALIGVDMAWIVTDTLLGLQVHWMYSILALGGALVWCKSVAFMFRLCFPAAEQVQVSKVMEQDTSSVLIV
jgi:hypothetical protein